MFEVSIKTFTIFFSILLLTTSYGESIRCRWKKVNSWKISSTAMRCSRIFKWGANTWAPYFPTTTLRKSSAQADDRRINESWRGRVFRCTDEWKTRLLALWMTLASPHDIFETAPKNQLRLPITAGVGGAFALNLLIFVLRECKILLVHELLSSANMLLD